MKYRKKPDVIEAWQFNGEDRMDWPDWVKGHPHAASQLDWPEDKTRTHIKHATQWLSIDTPEYQLRADVGDWIICVKGEIFPCKPDIFAATYEPAE